VFSLVLHDSVDPMLDSVLKMDGFVTTRAIRDNGTNNAEQRPSRIGVTKSMSYFGHQKFKHSRTPLFAYSPLNLHSIHWPFNHPWNLPPTPPCFIIPIYIPFGLSMAPPPLILILSPYSVLTITLTPFESNLGLGRKKSCASSTSLKSVWKSSNEKLRNTAARAIYSSAWARLSSLSV
jgi:hypothetical protein